MNNNGEMLVSRLTNLWRKPLPRPVRHGKTMRDHSRKSPLMPSRIATPEEMASAYKPLNTDEEKYVQDLMK